MGNTILKTLDDAKNWIHAMMQEERRHNSASRTLLPLMQDSNTKKMFIEAIYCIPVHEIGRTAIDISTPHYPRIQCYSVNVEYAQRTIDLDITANRLQGVTVWWDNEHDDYDVSYPELSSVTILENIHDFMCDVQTRRNAEDSIAALQAYNGMKAHIGSNRFHQPMILWVGYHLGCICQIYPALDLLVGAMNFQKNSFTSDDFHAMNQIVEQCCAVLETLECAKGTYDVNLLQ